MSSPKNKPENDEDLERLRRAALNTIPRFKDKPMATEGTGRLQQNLRTNNAIKANNKLYYNNNSHRNGSKRSNLIVLTKTDSELSNSQTDSQSNRFTKIMDKTSEVSEKRKRVLPGRFSRLERDDEDTDEDTDECSDDFSDDNQMTTNSAFNQTSDEQTVVFNVSQNLTNEESISDKIDLNQSMNDSIDCNISQISEIKDSTNDSIIKDKVKDSAINSSPTNATNSCNNSTDLERKERIKLNSNISKSEAFERRKQKFGQTSNEERVNSNTDSSNTRNHRSSVKNRLSIKSNHKQKNSNKNNEKSYKKSVSDRESIVSYRHHSNSRPQTMDSIDEMDDFQHSKKRLRSLVVMK